MCNNYCVYYVWFYRSIGQCCPISINNSQPIIHNCVTLGGGGSALTLFPREAMTFQQPYPFGMDPVSDLIVYILHGEHMHTHKRTHIRVDLECC